MIDQIELWQNRANTTGQMAIAVHLEEMAEWLETLEICPDSDYRDMWYVALSNLKQLSTAVKELTVRVEITDREKFADAVGDQIVTATAAGCRNGMNVSAIVAEINKSNWSKFDDNGMPIHDANGKVKKGPNYVKANLSGMY